MCAAMLPPERSEPEEPDVSQLSHHAIASPSPTKVATSRSDSREDRRGLYLVYKRAFIACLASSRCPATSQRRHPCLSASGSQSLSPPPTLRLSAGLITIAPHRT